MKILGSGKIDDFQKVILGEKVVKALNVKSGDSILFYRGGGDRVEMFKAEGAQVTDECDSRPHIHLRGIRSIICGLAALSILFIAVSIMLSSSFFDGKADLPYEGMSYIALGLAAAMIVAIFITTSRLDSREESQRLTTIGGPYTKDRLLGLNKLMSDGKVVTGNLYVNSLFGSNPVEVKVTIDYDEGGTATALTKCTKSVPGYSVHKIRVPSSQLGNGCLTLDLTYLYTDKMIHVISRYGISIKNPESMIIKVTEGDVRAEIHFDDRFQRSTFDEALFDPLDDDVAL